MGKSADQIRQEIDRERQDAGQKIDQLEQQVQGQTDHMKQQAQDTAQQVRGEAKAMVNDTVDTVKENLDLQQEIQERPLVAAGAALVGGFLLGSMMGGNGGGQQQSGGGQQRSYAYDSGSNTTGSGQQMSGGQSGGGQSGGGVSNGIRNAAKKSGLEDTIENAAAALMGSVTEQLKGTLDKQFPGYSEKMETAQHSSGSFTDKAKATQKEAQQA